MEGQWTGTDGGLGFFEESSIQYDARCADVHYVLCVLLCVSSNVLLCVQHCTVQYSAVLCMKYITSLYSMCCDVLHSALLIMLSALRVSRDVEIASVIFILAWYRVRQYCAAL